MLHSVRQRNSTCIEYKSNGIGNWQKAYSHSATGKKEKKQNITCRLFNFGVKELTTIFISFQW